MSQLGSDEYIAESAYLVERGVRAMSIVDHIQGDAEVFLQEASRLEVISAGMKVIPFVVIRSDGIADCGFAAEQWVIDLYEWLVQTESLPENQVHRIRGLLLGYNAPAIREHEARCSGRRFTWSL